jgi:hypothetical protein
VDDHRIEGVPTIVATIAINAIAVSAVTTAAAAAAAAAAHVSISPGSLDGVPEVGGHIRQLEDHGERDRLKHLH